MALRELDAVSSYVRCSEQSAQLGQGLTPVRLSACCSWSTRKA